MKFFQDNIFIIVAAFVSGAMLLWPFVNRRAAGATVNHVGATRLINDHNAQILDVRSAAEYAAAHVANSKNIPLEDIEKRRSELQAEKPVIVVCQTGQRASKAAGQLRTAGLSQVFVLDGGVQAWKEAGLPITK